MPLAREMDTLHVAFSGIDVPNACCVNVGNPHSVFFVPDATAIPLENYGPRLENDALFPDRCNIEFAHIIDDTHIRMRVWERGTGITQACGSAALATLVAAVRRKLITGRKATIHMDGGDLIIEWREKDDHIILSGAASFCFTGTLSEELVSSCL